MTSEGFLFSAFCGTHSAYPFRSGVAATLQILIEITVGFQNKETLGGGAFAFLVGTFDSVAGKPLTLNDYVLQYDGDDQTLQSVWLMSAGCANTKQYWYVNEACQKEWGMEVGWYNAEGCNPEDECGDDPLPYGCGFAVNSQSADVKMVFAGQVAQQAKKINVVGGGAFSFGGNCMPVNYTLSDLTLIYEGDDQTLQTVWTISRGCANEKQFWYVNEACQKEWGMDVGWYDAEGCNPEDACGDFPIPAGMGLAINATNPCQLNVPSPIEKDEE